MHQNTSGNKRSIQNLNENSFEGSCIKNLDELDVYLNDSKIDTTNNDKNKNDNENNDYLEQQSKLPFTRLFKWKPFINAFQTIEYFLIISKILIMGENHLNICT